MLLGVKDEVSLMAWANKFYTLGFTTATLRLPPCLRQPRATSTCAGSAAPGPEVLGNRSHPTRTNAFGHLESSRANFRPTCCALRNLSAVSGWTWRNGSSLTRGARMQWEQQVMEVLALKFMHFWSMGGFQKIQSPIHPLK